MDFLFDMKKKKAKKVVMPNTTKKAIIFMAKFNVTQPELAAMLNVSPRTLWGRIKGERPWLEHEEDKINELYKTKPNQT